jgi:hypothetical protein
MFIKGSEQVVPETVAVMSHVAASQVRRFGNNVAASDSGQGRFGTGRVREVAFGDPVAMGGRIDFELRRKKCQFVITEFREGQGLRR